MTGLTIQSRAELDRELAAIREGMLALGERVVEQPTLERQVDHHHDICLDQVPNSDLI